MDLELMRNFWKVMRYIAIYTNRRPVAAGILMKLERKKGKIYV